MKGVEDDFEDGSDIQGDGVDEDRVVCARAVVVVSEAGLLVVRLRALSRDVAPLGGLVRSLAWLRRQLVRSKAHLINLATAAPAFDTKRRNIHGPVHTFFIEDMGQAEFELLSEKDRSFHALP